MSGSNKPSSKEAEARISLAQLTNDTKLDLAHLGLSQLPETATQLKYVESINLCDNTLTGLPKSLGKLNHLKSLDLSSNEFRSLPEVLNNIKQLNSLNLAYNKLSTLPEWIVNLTNLRQLDLSNCHLTSLPQTLSKLTGLSQLIVGNNELVNLPEWIGDSINLSALGLLNCQLTHLPETLGKLTKLKDLHLGHNKLTSLPETLNQLIELEELNIGDNQLTGVPEWVGRFTNLRRLDLARCQLKAVPEWLPNICQLQHLNLADNQISSLPERIGELKNLEVLILTKNYLRTLPAEFSKLRKLDYLCFGYKAGGNPLTGLPECLRHLQQLRNLTAWNCNLSHLPEWLGEMTSLNRLDFAYNQLSDLPSSIAGLRDLTLTKLDHNPLNPELAAAYNEGLHAVRRYLRAKEGPQVVLNEAKLILVGEGEVGKSCLLAALRNEPWSERDSTHGIEIKPVNLVDSLSEKEIILNGWDFGGQRVYRPTHQLFFSAPAVYLVVWKPREGAQQGFVKEWIKLIKHREPDAKILVVATHGGPGQRQPDLDRQEIWDLFGRDTVLNFFWVDSKPDSQTGQPFGIAELKNAIARVAAQLPEMGRKVPTRWKQVREALGKTGVPYLSLKEVLKTCQQHEMGLDEAHVFVSISHRLGHLIFYEHDPALRDIVILKPDWLTTAISFVLDDKQTRDSHGLASFERLGLLWNNPTKDKEFRYPPELHYVFLRLMERFDISYRIAEPFNKKPTGTSLIAQLVPDVRPILSSIWDDEASEGDKQQVQVCRIVEAKNGQSATAEGLFYQLIVRLHKYSLGRLNHEQSVHWQRGLVLDDDYNGRALMEHVGNDIRITVRAAYPERFLSVLTNEVKWLVENFWAGLRCDVMVPCTEPCGKNRPGMGLFEVQKLIESKKRDRPEYPCPICNEWQNIDGLLRNAPALQSAITDILLINHAELKGELINVRKQLIEQHDESLRRFDGLTADTQRILSKVDDAFTHLMQALTDEAKDGPRLFSFVPVDPGFLDRPNWMSQKFRLTLWCEHTRLPLPILNKKDKNLGVYDLTLPREWLVASAPFLKLLTGTLSLILPVASSVTKLIMDDASYKSVEKELDLGQKSIESVIKGGEKSGEWLAQSNAADLEHGEGTRAHGAILRNLHSLLADKDPSFGGLVRVQNKRHEFLWVHPKFADQY